MNRRDAAGTRDPQGHDRRGLILTMLRASDAPLSIADIADELGVHPNTVRFHLDTLIAADRVEQVPGDTGAPGRPPILYRARRAMDRNGPSNYRLLATMLTSQLATSTRNPAKTATELGRTWGPALVDAPRRHGTPTKTQALTRIVDLLADLGFEPEPHTGAHTRQIRLRHCPFLALVDDHAEVICPLHLGLMQGALAALNSPVTVDRLEPFVEPDLCVAHVASNAAATTSTP